MIDLVHLPPSATTGQKAKGCPKKAKAALEKAAEPALEKAAPAGEVRRGRRAKNGQKELFVVKEEDEDEDEEVPLEKDTKKDKPTGSLEKDTKENKTNGCLEKDTKEGQATGS